MSGVIICRVNVYCVYVCARQAKDMYCAACGSKHKEVTELQRMLSFITSE